MDPGGVIDVGNSLSGPAFFPREIQDAHNRKTSDAGVSLGENNMFEVFFIGVEENLKLNVLLIF